jgi:hypothetical protein
MERARRDVKLLCQTCERGGISTGDIIATNITAHPAAIADGGFIASTI